MSAAVRPIRLPGEAALETVRQRAQAALDAWAREWVTGYEDDPQQLQISILSNDAHVHGREFEASRDEAGCLWFGSNAADRLKFSRAVVGPELMPGSTCADEWVLAVVERARESRNRALGSALFGMPASRGSPMPGTTPSASPLPKPDCLPARLFTFGAGAVLLMCEPLGLHAIADNTVWHSVPPGDRAGAQHRPALAPLEKAVRGRYVSLDVMLGGVEIELPKLLDLRPGDVLRLPQRLDQGIAVLCDGKQLARAALGEREGRKCMQMLSNAP